MDSNHVSFDTFCPMLSIGKAEKVACDPNCAWYYIRNHDSGACAIHDLARFMGDMPDYGTKKLD